MLLNFICSSFFLLMTDIPLFVYLSSVNGHLGHFELLAVQNKAAVNILV